MAGQDASVSLDAAIPACPVAKDAEALLQAIETAPDVHVFMVSMDQCYPEAYDMDPGEWAAVVGWCKCNPAWAFSVRDNIVGALRRHTLSLAQLGHIVWTTLKTKVVMVPYSADAPRVPCIPRVSDHGPMCYRMYVAPGQSRLDTLLMLNEWVRDISEDGGGRKLVKDAVGGIESVPCEMVRAFNTTFGAGMFFSRVQDRARTLHPTIGFTITAIKGGEAMVSRLLERVLVHNMRHVHNPCYPDGSSAWVVLETPLADGQGCVKWTVDSVNLSGLPDGVLARPEADASYTIGPNGRNIKRFNQVNKIEQGGLRVVCLPASPQLPIIYMAPYMLTPLQCKAVVDMVRAVDNQVRPLTADSDEC